MELKRWERTVQEVTARDLAAFLEHHYPDMEWGGEESVAGLFDHPSSDTIHLARAQPGLNPSDTEIVRQWLNGTLIETRAYADDVFSYLAAAKKIRPGTYLITFD